jgi:hypothetical protein
MPLVSSCLHHLPFPFASLNPLSQVCVSHARDDLVFGFGSLTHRFESVTQVEEQTTFRH